MDWDGVAFHAESVRAVRMLNLGLLLAHDLVGEAIPEPLREDLEADVKASRLAAQARDMLLGDPDAVPGLRAITRYHLQLADRLLDGASYCCSMVLTPQPADWKALPLPSRLSFLYRVYRPLRLVYRHAIRPVPGRLSHLIRRG
jgi:hypothetical protein